MLDEATKWLLRAITFLQIDLAKSALLDGATPDFVDSTIGNNALHEAILKDNVELVKLLLDGIQSKKTKKADINLVGHSFEASISLVGRSSLNNKMELMKTIIENRQEFNIDLFERYLLICTQLVDKDGIFKKSDFAILAHYVSRICNVHVGKLLNKDKNSDRYIAHLCQYSFAEKDGIGLEGWWASEFLPIRIFSLFEILVKIKKEIILIPKESKENICNEISQEILVEIETLRLEQERMAIHEATNLSDQDKNNLYRTLAVTFLSRVKNNSRKEFSLSGGDKTHAIYISFKVDNEDLIIRHDNVGSGSYTRHIEDENGIYPRFVKVSLKKYEDLINFITTLFSIQEEILPPKPREKEYGTEKYEIEMKKYKDARDEKLSRIYDDANKLEGIYIPPKEFCVKEQTAGTCTTTSHQVGLLSRFKDQNLYEFIVAEEKRCIFQVDRTTASLDASNVIYWDESKLEYNQPEMVAHCFSSSLENFKHVYDFATLLFSNTDFEQTESSIKSKFLNYITDLLDKCITHKENIIYIKSIIEKIEEIRNATLKEQASFYLLLDPICASLRMQIGALETNKLERYEHFNKARALFMENFNLVSDNYTAMAPMFKMYLHYSIGFCSFNMYDLQNAETHYKSCLQLCELFINKAKVNNDRYSGTFFFNSANETKNDSVCVYSIYMNALFSLGFLNIESKKLDAAEVFFEKTATKKEYHDVIMLNSDGIPKIAEEKIYPINALFGLSIIDYQHSTDEKNSSFIKEERLKLSVKKLYMCMEDKNSIFSSRASKLLNHITHKMEESMEQRDKKKPNLSNSMN